MTVVNLSATRQEWLASECIESLSTKWRNLDMVVKLVRKRYGWAMDREIWSALDQLHEAGRVESRHAEKKTQDLRDSTITVTQWRLT